MTQGYGELSPIGLDAALCVLCSYGSACVAPERAPPSPLQGRSLSASPSSRHLAGFDRPEPEQGPSRPPACSPERLLRLSYQHGLVGLLSLTLLPQVRAPIDHVL